MLGILFGLLSAVAFAANSIVSRRGMLRVSPNYIATISIFTGFVFFLPIAGITGDLLGIGQFHWKAYLFWALSGVIHFVLGRTWGFRSLHLLGSTRSSIVINLSPIVTVVFAMTIFKEKMTLPMVFGILFSLTGPLLIILKEQTANGPRRMSSLSGKELDRRTLHMGVFYGLGTALFWGSSFIFIKFGLESGGSAISGNLIAYAAASTVIIPSMILRGETRKEILGKDRRALQAAILSGVLISIAQLLRFLSFGYGSAIVVSFMGRTSPIWILLFAFLFNREYESFSRWVFLGNGLLILGALLFIFP